MFFQVKSGWKLEFPLFVIPGNWSMPTLVFLFLCSTGVRWWLASKSINILFGNIHCWKWL